MVGKGDKPFLLGLSLFSGGKHAVSFQGEKNGLKSSLAVEGAGVQVLQSRYQYQVVVSNIFYFQLPTLFEEMIHLA